MRTLMTWLVLLTTASLPLEGAVDLPGIGNVSRVLGGLSALAWLAVVLQSGAFRRPHPLHFAMALFVAWSLASSWWTLDGSATQSRALTYLQLLAFSVVVWETVVSRLVLDRVLRAFLAGCLTATGALLGGYVLSPAHVETHGRVTVGSFNANDAGLILALGLSVAVHVLAHLPADRTRRLWCWVAAAYLPLGSFAVLVTGSRSALAAVLPCFVYAGWLLWRRHPALLILGGGSATILLLGAVPLLPARVVARLDGTWSELMQGDLNHRQEVWAEGARLVSEHPLVGVGSGAFRSAAVGVDKVGHNLVLSVLAELGVVGLLLFAAVIVIAVRAGWRSPASLRVLWVALVAGWSSAAMLHNWEYRKLTWLLFTLMVAGELRTPATSDAGHPGDRRVVEHSMDTSPRRRLRAPGILVIALGLVLGTGVVAQAFPDTPYPQPQLERTIRTAPFVGSTLSSRDNEASAYVARDNSLWMADDDGRGVHELNPDTGQLKRSFDEATLSNVKEYGGTATAGTWRVRDLEGLAYDANNDVLYLFSGKCCTAQNLPTVFRLVRGEDGRMQLDSFRALASGSDFTAAAWNPNDGRLYVGAQSELRSYDYASNAVGPAFLVTHLSRITGLTFSADGRDLWVAHAGTKVTRVDWASRSIVAGWSFNLASFGIQDIRAVEVFDDRLWVSDGADTRPLGDPLTHAIFVFSLQLPPPDFNIVGNSGFENGLTGWKSSSGLDQFGGGHSGGASARLTNATGAPATLTLNDSPNWVGTTVQGTYTVSAWVRSDNLTGPVDLRVREYDENGVKLDETSAKVALSPAWQQVTLTVTPEAGSDLDLNVFAYKVAAGARFDVDDVVINFQ